MKAGKYQNNVQSKAAYLASRPKESTYDLDKHDEVFQTQPEEKPDSSKNGRLPLKQRKKKKKAVV